MARRIRDHNWAATPLGPMEAWSAPLRSTVDLLVAHDFPMVVLWGPDLIQIYNDGYRVIMGDKHPAGLGQRTRDCWPEVWHINAPIYERVHAGETITFEDALYPITRHGPLEDAWFTLTYSPIRDHGHVAGVLVTVFETTPQHKEAGQREAAEQAARASAQQFQALTMAGANLIYRMSPDWRVMYRLDGRGVLIDTPEPIEDWVDIYIPHDNLPAVRAAIAKAICNKAPFELEHRVRQADGSIGWVLSRAIPILDAQGEISEWLGAAADITARKEAEARLRDSEALRRIALAGGRMGSWRWDLAGRQVWGDAQFLALWGFPPSDAPLPLSYFLDRQSLEGTSQTEGVVGRAIAAGEEFDAEVEVTAGPTAGTWLRWRGRPFADDPTVLFGVSFDITGQKRAEAALRESEERLRQFGDASQDVLWIRSAESFQWEYLTPAFETIYGLDRTDALRGNNMVNWLELIVPEDRALAAQSLSRVRDGEWVTFEYRIRRPSDGEIRWLRDTDFPIRSAAGGVQHIGGIGHDITELKQTEEALAAAQSRQTALLEGIPQLVWRASGRGEWTWASPQWTEFTSQAEPDSLGWGWLEALHPEDRALTKAAWEKAADSGNLDVEYRICHCGEGSYRWFHTRASPVRDKRGQIVEWLGTSTDIHDLREIQETQKVLVAELQHRTRNLMGVVRSMSDKTSRASADLPDFRARFRDRLDALARVQGLLSRLNDHDRVTFDELIRAELEAMDGSTGRVSLEGPDGVRLRSSMVQTLAMAVHELATNAVKYGALGQAGGRLAVRWSLQPNGPGDRPWLHIDWRETGVAMPPNGSRPRGGGQGRELIERALPYQLSARTTYEMASDGVRCTISIPVSKTTVSQELERA